MHVRTAKLKRQTPENLRMIMDIIKYNLTVRCLAVFALIVDRTVTESFPVLGSTAGWLDTFAPV